MLGGRPSFTRRLYAELRVWQWTVALADGGKLPNRWWQEEKFIGPLQTWYERGGHAALDALTPGMGRDRPRDHGRERRDLAQLAIKWTLPLPERKIDFWVTCGGYALTGHFAANPDHPRGEPPKLWRCDRPDRLRRSLWCGR